MSEKSPEKNGGAVDPMVATVKIHEALAKAADLSPEEAPAEIRKGVAEALGLPTDASEGDLMDAYDRMNMARGDIFGDRW